MLLAFLLTACSVSETPSRAVHADPDGILAMLAGPLAVPESRIDRMQARIGPTCALVIDPADPTGCDPETTCMATAFASDAGAWRVVAMAAAGRVPDDHQCREGRRLQALPAPAD